MPGDDPVQKALDAITSRLAKLDRLEAIEGSLARMEQQQQEHQTAIAKLEAHHKEVVLHGADSSRGRSLAQGHHEDRPPKFHKLDFPKFDGKTDPLLFINKCESYFLQQRIIEEEKVWLASFNMDGAAQQWYMRLQREEGTPPWRRFTELLNLRFGPPLRANPLGELAACHRTGTVEEYSTRFLDLLARAGPLNEGQQVQLFTAGLLEPLAIDVQIQNPLTLEVAMSLARAYERRESVTAAAGRVAHGNQGARLAPSRRGILPTPPAPPLALPAPNSGGPSVPSSSATTVAGRTVKKLTQDEMEERRRLGLCFNCDERYVRGHNRQCKHLFLLELDDNPEDANSSDEDKAGEEPGISLHAITGIRTGDTMKVLLSLGTTTIQALLDSGSTHNFISETAAARCGLQFETRSGMRVSVANGERLPCLGVHRGASFTINAEPFTADLFVLPLAGYDMVLGTQWLATLGPILWDFSRFTMAFWRKDHHVEWVGLADAPPARLQAIAGPWAMDTLLQEFEDIFAEPRGLPPPRPCDHRIHLLPGTAPVTVRPYRYPALQKDELERQCRDMLQRGVIRRSSSAFSSPVLLVKKADGSWRFCVDYRALNSRTVKDSFPIPVVDELLDELRGAKYFTKLDLRSGYHQVRMNEDDIAKTAFRTHDGLYEFLVMPFGLSNAPATFQALMNTVLQPFLRRFVLVFFDDILIFSNTWSEHLHHVRTVLTALHQHELYLKRSKCSFGARSVAYLGHVISEHGVAMDAGKIQAIIDWPTPRSVRALRGFLGLANYYRKFVKDFGALAAPLTQLLKKEGFQWSQAAVDAFQRLKSILTTAPVLCLPDFSRPFVVECDASGAGCGAVLHQLEGPIAFFSRPMAARHRGLAAYERELIGLVQAVRHWRPYLWGQTFTVITDHYSLKFLLDQRLATIPQHQWVSKLLGFDFTVEYRSGRSNVVADALSRRDTEETSLFSLSMPRFDIVDDLRRAASRDPALVTLCAQILAGELGSPWELVDGVVTYKRRLYLPPSSDLLETVIAAIHQVGHEGTEKTLQRFRRDFYAPHARALIQDYVRYCFTCQSNKTEHLSAAGLLQPLPVPSAVWSDISMDFVEGLPKVGGKSVILTVVDRFSKYAHFIALGHPYSAESVAAAFFSEIVRLHGMPTSIVSDRDPVFTSTFWKTLFHLLGTKLHMSSAFHPQSDGQTEAVNKVIGMYLRCLTGDRPRQWLRWLPWAEYVYNTSFHTAVKDTPFKVVYGREPPEIRSYEPGDCRVVAVAQAMEERNAFLEEVRVRLEQAQAVAKRAYDRGHRELQFAVGDWVMLRVRHRAPASIPQPARGKLRPKFYGPYRVTAVINKAAYRLALPPGARIHDVFHVGLLKPFKGTPPAVPPALPPMHHGVAQPAPARAVKARLARGVRQILIQWIDQPASAATWEDLHVFQERYPHFQLEDKLLVEEGRDVMWGKPYSRRKRSG